MQDSIKLISRALQYASKQRVTSLKTDTSKNPTIQTVYITYSVGMQYLAWNMKVGKAKITFCGQTRKSWQKFEDPYFKSNITSIYDETMKRWPKDLALSLGDLLSGEDPSMFTVSQASHSMIKFTQMTLNKAYAVTATSFLVCLPWPKILKG